MSERDYSKIIDLEHHTSVKRPRMTAEKRAAQFAPFAALSAHSAAIREAERKTEDFRELGETDIENLNTAMKIIEDNIKDTPCVNVCYFIPDEKKSGGRYEKFTGSARTIDMCRRIIIFTDGTEIALDSIRSINGEIIEKLAERE